jgi:hypothetical protein
MSVLLFDKMGFIDRFFHPQKAQNPHHEQCSGPGFPRVTNKASQKPESLITKIVD